MKILSINKLSTLPLALACVFLNACNGDEDTTSGSNTRLSAAGATTMQKPLIMGYYTNWAAYAANYQPANIPNEVDEILYAFTQVGGCNTQEADIATEADFAKGSAKCVVQRNANGVMLQPGLQDFKLWTTDGYSDFYNYNLDGKDIGGLGNIAKTLKTGKSVLLSIGGWTLSAPIREAIKPEHQAAFIQSIIDFMHKAEQDAANHGVKNKFAGVDIDWEPNANQWTLPSTDVNFVSLAKADLDNYAAFLSNLKAALAKNNYPTLKTAMTASPKAIKDVNRISPNYWSKLSSLGIFLNLMTYDYNGQNFGSSCSYTGFNSPLWSDQANPCDDNKDYNVNDSVITLNQTGVAMSSIEIGVPAYGRAYSMSNSAKVTEANPYVAYIAGVYIENPAVPSFHSTWTYRELITGRAFGGTSESENVTWKTVVSKATVGQSVATATIDKDISAWISYTSKADAAKVMDYAKTTGLAGVMIWELDQDVQKGDTMANGTAINLNDYSLIAGLAGSVSYKESSKLTVSADEKGFPLQIFSISNGSVSVGKLDYMEPGATKVYTTETNPSIDAIDGAKGLVVAWSPWGGLPELTTCRKFDFDKDTRITINGTTKLCEIQ